MGVFSSNTTSTFTVRDPSKVPKGIIGQAGTALFDFIDAPSNIIRSIVRFGQTQDIDFLINAADVLIPGREAESIDISEITGSKSLPLNFAALVLSDPLTLISGIGPLTKLGKATKLLRSAKLTQKAAKARLGLILEREGLAAAKAAGTDIDLFKFATRTIKEQGTEIAALRAQGEKVRRNIIEFGIPFSKKLRKGVGNLPKLQRQLREFAPRTLLANPRLAELTSKALVLNEKANTAERLAEQFLIDGNNAANSRKLAEAAKIRSDARKIEASIADIKKSVLPEGTSEKLRTLGRQVKKTFKARAENPLQERIAELGVIAENQDLFKLADNSKLLKGKLKDIAQAQNLSETQLSLRMLEIAEQRSKFFGPTKLIREGKGFTIDPSQSKLTYESRIKEKRIMDPNAVHPNTEFESKLVAAEKSIEIPKIPDTDRVKNAQQFDQSSKKLAKEIEDEFLSQGVKHIFIEDLTPLRQRIFQERESLIGIEKDAVANTQKAFKELFENIEGNVPVDKELENLFNQAAINSLIKTNNANFQSVNLLTGSSIAKSFDIMPLQAKVEFINQLDKLAVNASPFARRRIAPIVQTFLGKQAKTKAPFITLRTAPKTVAFPAETARLSKEVADIKSKFSAKLEKLGDADLLPVPKAIKATHPNPELESKLVTAEKSVEIPEVPLIDEAKLFKARNPNANKVNEEFLDLIRRTQKEGEPLIFPPNLSNRDKFILQAMKDLTQDEQAIREPFTGIIKNLFFNVEGGERLTPELQSIFAEAIFKSQRTLGAEIDPSSVRFLTASDINEFATIADVDDVISLGVELDRLAVNASPFARRRIAPIVEAILGKQAKTRAPSIIPTVVPHQLQETILKRQAIAADLEDALNAAKLRSIDRITKLKDRAKIAGKLTQPEIQFQLDLVEGVETQIKQARRQRIDVKNLDSSYIDYIKRVTSEDAIKLKKRNPKKYQLIVQEGKALFGSLKHKRVLYPEEFVPELNKILKEKYNLKFNFFNEDPIAAVVARKREQIIAIGRARSANIIVEQFAQEGIKGVKARDFLKQVGLNPDEIAGLPAISNKLILPQQVVDDALKTDRLLRSDSLLNTPFVGSMLRFMDWVNLPYRALLTSPFPGFNFRNMVSNIFLNHIGGVPSVENGFRHYIDSTMFQHKIRLAELGKVTLTPIERQIANELRNFDVSGGGALYREFLLAGGKRFEDKALKISRGFVDLRKPLSTPIEKIAGALGLEIDLDKKLGAFANPLVGRAFAQFAEDNARIAHYFAKRGIVGSDEGLKFIKGGLDPLEAARSVNRYLFSARNLTQRERTLLRPTILFYTWTRNNIPLMLRTAVENPRVLAVFDKIAQVGPDDLPDYLREGGTISLGEGKFATTAGFLPPDDLNLFNIGSVDPIFTVELKRLAQKVANLTSPAIKIPFEIVSGESAFSRRPLRDTPLFELIKEKSPLSRAFKTVNRFTDPDDEFSLNLISFITGARTFQTSQTRAELDTLRRKFIASGKGRRSGFLTTTKREFKDDPEAKRFQKNIRKLLKRLKQERRRRG